MISQQFYAPNILGIASKNFRAMGLHRLTGKFTIFSDDLSPRILNEAGSLSERRRLDGGLLCLNKQSPVVLKFIKLFYHELNVLSALVLPDARF